jgi:hypothetical protein
MNLDNLQQKLIAAARTAQPSDRIPYAFEKRIMARLAEAAHIDVLSAWSAALWRAAVPCVAITLLSGAWLLWSGHQQDSSEFSQEFDTAVFASAGSADEAW